MLKSDRPMVQLLKEYGISETAAYRWRDEALQAMKDSFSNKGKNKSRSSEAEKERLLKIIGEQAVAIFLLDIVYYLLAPSMRKQQLLFCLNHPTQ